MKIHKSIQTSIYRLILMLVISSNAWSNNDSNLVSICDKLEGLNSQKGHFDGDDWNEKIDKWNGEKHTLLLALAETIKLHPISVNNLIKICIKPDKKVNEQSSIQNLNFNWIWQKQNTKKELDNSEFWFFSWRGNRDFLILLRNNDDFIGAAWLYAYE